ncbi:7579_t:CDS:2, partial [Gigaspora margarita]
MIAIILKKKDLNDQAKDQVEDQVEDQAEEQGYEPENNKPHSHVKCNYCPKIFDRGIATRMQAHLNDHCLEVPENAKTNPNTKCQKNDTSIPYTSPSPKRSKTILIKNFIDHVNEEEQESLEFMLAQALFATG